MCCKRGDAPIKVFKLQQLTAALLAAVAIFTVWVALYGPMSQPLRKPRPQKDQRLNVGRVEGATASTAAAGCEPVAFDDQCEYYDGFLDAHAKPGKLHGLSRTGALFNHTFDPFPHLDASPSLESALADPCRESNYVHMLVLTNHYYTYTDLTLRGALLNGYLPHLIGFSDAAKLAWEREVARQPGTLTPANATSSGRRYTPDGFPVSNMEPDLPDFQFGNGKPLSWILGPLLTLRDNFGGGALVVVVDAHDTAVTMPAKDLVCRFRAAQIRNPKLTALFGAEQACFPLSEEQCALFPQPPKAPFPPSGDPEELLPYRHLNTGGWIASVDHAIAIMNALEARYFNSTLGSGSLLDARENDQGAVQLLYIDEAERDKLGLGLDYGAGTFFPYHLQQDRFQMEWKSATNELVERGNSQPQPGQEAHPLDYHCNQLTGHCPAMLHFNGGSKPFQLGVEDRLPTAQAVNMMGPALGNWLGEQRLGLFSGLTLRQFLCDQRWTDDTLENRARPLWLPDCRGHQQSPEEADATLDAVLEASKNSLAMNKAIWG